VEAIEHDKDDSNSGRKSQNTGGGKAIRFQLSVGEGPHRILLVLIVAVKWGKIEI